MKSCVISLTTAFDRREHIAQQFGKQAIAFEFFDAVTPNDIGELSAQFDIAFSDNQRLSLGEKACFLSHISLWQKMLDENIDYMAIFEDDICLGMDIAYFLSDDFIGNLPSFDIVKLETFFEKVFIGGSINNYHHRQIQRLHSPHMGAGAYIINQKSIKKIMHQIKKTPACNLMAVDHILFEENIKPLTVYQLNPAVCIQQMFLNDRLLPSQLEAHRQQNATNSQFNHSLSKKISRFFWRIKRSIGKRTFYKIIDFQ